MINNLYSIGSSALSNAQVSVNNASNNVANADTVGYKRTTTVYDSSTYVDVGGVSVGTGASVTEIQSQVDWFVEMQYLDATSELSEQNALYEYLAQAESLLNQTEDSGLNAALSDFWSAWNSVAEDPASEAAREELLGNAEMLVYEINATQNELDEQVDAINSDIHAQVDEANQLIESIATLNAAIVADPDNLTLANERDQAVLELSAIIEISVDQEADGQVSISTNGYSLVEGTSHNELVYGAPKASYSSMSASTWEGDVNFSGESSEEILLEFVSVGPDGSAQYKVSHDGGQTWETDEGGTTVLYTATDSSDPVTIAGVDIWFDGTGDHAVGDRVSIVPKTGLYWSPNEGESLYNITPLTDDSGVEAQGRVSSGSLAGLFQARDDNLVPYMDELDDLAAAIIWETNLIHSQGAGNEHHTSLTGTYAVTDSSVPISDSDLAFADNVEAGTISFTTYDADGALSSTINVAFDPATDSLNDLAAAISADPSGELAATVNADGTLTIATAGGAAGLEVAGDDTGMMAALGLNTFFSGSDAGSMAVNGYVNTDASHVNCQVVEDDGTVASGSNETAKAISDLSTQEVTVGESTDSMQGFLSALLSEVGTASATAQLQQTYASGSLDFYEEQRQAASGVNIDEETINLTKYQQQYEAAARIISTAQEMFETILGMF